MGTVIVISFFVFTGYLCHLFFIQRKKLKMQDKINKLSILFILPFLVGCGMEQVDEGYRGIYTSWGKVIGEPLTPGLQFYNPISGDIFEMDVRERKFEDKTECFTNDTQKVVVSYAVTLYPKQADIAKIYSQFGRDWETKVIPQVVLGSMKDAIGQYKADDLVGKREAVKNKAQEEVKSNLETRGVIITRLDLTNLDFDDTYEKAVEDKVVAIQRAAESKNKTVQVEEEAKQTVAKATADAEAMKIKTSALSQNKGLVDYEAVQRWDGKLPQYILGNGAMPFLNLK